ncbi:S9 family peptidase [Rhodococcus wratislaviensis]|nr:prolyl oligopeptidase family serine peptidase [Rhodococcus wratislaviensis]
MTPSSQVRYGGHQSQFVEIWHPGVEDVVAGLAIVLHGGWWRARHDLHLMDGLCADLAEAGWLVANVEYRRTGGGGGWPHTLHDVFGAIDAVHAFEPAARGLASVAIGHSAGAHLALMTTANRKVSSAIALAPITDLRRTFIEELGEGATSLFIGDSLDEQPEVFAAASPICQLPMGGRLLVLHGDHDDRVPVQHSRDFITAARAAGDMVDYAEIAGADHFEVIDPLHRSWGEARKWLTNI